MGFGGYSILYYIVIIRDARNPILIIKAPTLSGFFWASYGFLYGVPVRVLKGSFGILAFGFRG